MKKKIFCIIVVVLCLVSVLTLAVSASYDESIKDFYEWRYHWFSSGNTANNVGKGELVIPETYYDIYKTADGDFADRYYLMGFKTNLSDGDDIGIHERGVINTTYDIINVSNTAYYKQGVANYGYHVTYSTPEVNYVKYYDAYTDFSYTDVYIYNYFGYDYQATTMYDITQTTVQKALENNTYETIYAYQFHKVGRVNCETVIVFYDTTNGLSKTINRTSTITVENFTDSEKDNYQYGYDNGYADGYNKAVVDLAESQQDFSLKGMINAIAEAPFRFIDTAFGFEIFGVNVANTIRVVFTLGLVALVAFAVVRLFI